MCSPFSLLPPVKPRSFASFSVPPILAPSPFLCNGESPALFSPLALFFLSLPYRAGCSLVVPLFLQLVFTSPRAPRYVPPIFVTEATFLRPSRCPAHRPSLAVSFQTCRRTGILRRANTRQLSRDLLFFFWPSWSLSCLRMASPMSGFSSVLYLRPGGPSTAA